MLQNKSKQGCTQGSRCCKGSADQVLLQAYTRVRRVIKLRVSPKDQRLQRFGRPPAAADTNICVTQCRVAPRVKVNERLADQVLLAVSTCVLPNRRIPGCTQGSTVARFGRPVFAVSTRTHTCVAEYVSSRLRPTIKGYKGFADQVLLRAYTCVLQKSGLRPESKD